MTVAIAINKSWNIYNFRKGLVKSLIARGNKVIAIAPRDQYSEILESWGCIYEHIPMSSSGTNPFREITTVKKFTEILKRRKVNILLNYTVKCNIYGSIAAHQLGIPVICNISGLGTVFLKNRLSSLIAITLYKLALKKVAHVFFQNTSDSEEFQKRIPIDNSKSSLLPGSGINLDEWEFQPYIYSEKPTFLMVARLLVEKGVYEFIEAAKKVKLINPDVRFRLIGILEKGHSRAVKRKDLDSWIKQGIIEYEPQRDDINEQMTQAQAVIQPSYREGMSRVLLEAGAIGRPAITTRVAGCQDIVEHGVNGLLCEPRDSSDMANKILEFIQLNQKTQEKMSVAARKNVETKFDEKQVIGSYLATIDKLLRAQHR